jgi:hypothetical protein
MNYKKLYNNLMISRKFLNRKKGLNIYYEAHHIKPKSFGGEGNYRNTKHPNIVLLTPKEHYIAHLLLVAIYPNSSAMKKALWNMCNTSKKQRYKPSAKTFENIRLDYIKSVQGVGGTFYNKKHTKESLIKISNASKGRKANLGNKHTDESKKKISEARKGKIFISNETKIKISKAISGGNHYNAIQIICEKSGKIFGSGKELSEYLQIPFSTIRRWLNGTTKPPNTFHYKRQNLAYDQ